MLHEPTLPRAVHASFWALLAIVAGCDRPKSSPATPLPLTKLDHSLINERDRTHDFGVVVGSASRVLTYRYPLRNDSGQAVVLREVINRIPCCGTVQVGATRLEPGQATEAEVQFRVAGKFGLSAHEAEIVIDPPGDGPIVLRTMADVVPPIRFEERPDLPSSKPGFRSATYEVIAAGDQTDPFPSLNQVVIEAQSPTRWAGPVIVDDGEGPIRRQHRSIVVDLDQRGEPGTHSDAIRLKLAKQLIATRPLTWEVTRPIEVVPKVIALTPTKRSSTIVIQSRDGKPFRIVTASADVAGIKVRPSDDAVAAATQTIGVQWSDNAKASDPKGVLQIRTDHPDQMAVSIPIVIIERGD